MRILFIEDNPDFSEPVKDLLEDEGHSVVIINNADDAVHEISKLNIYDIILLDVMLRLGGVIKKDEAPETGIAIFNRIRKINNKIPVLILTALSKNELCNFVYFDKITEYHTKPMPKNTIHFLELINKLVA